MATPVLQCRRITKRFSGVTALAEVDFSLLAGEVHGLVGSNGAGKSTLMKTLAGALPDHEGTVLLAGHSVELSSPQAALDQGIAMVYQELSGIGQVSVAENLFLGRQPTTRCGRVDWRTMWRKAREYLGELEIEIDVDRRLDRYPLVIRQMVELDKHEVIRRMLGHSGPQVEIGYETGAVLRPRTTATPVLRASGLAMMFIAEGMSRFLTKSATFKIPDVLSRLGNEVFDLGGRLGLPAGLRDYLTIPYSAIVAAAVLLVGHVVLQHPRFGRYVYMTGGNREAARLAGVRTGRIVVACLALCAVTAALGGLVNAGRLTNATLDQNKDLLLSAVACVVLGGTSLFGGEGGIGKTLVGVLTFTVLNVGLMQVNWINDLARQLLTGLVLLVALVVNGVLAKGRS